MTTRNQLIPGLAACILLATQAILFAAKPEAGGPPEIVGTLSLRIENCGNPDHQGAHSTYILSDKTGRVVDLDVSALDVESLEVLKQVRVRGRFKDLPEQAIRRMPPFVVSELTYEEEPEKEVESGAVAADGEVVEGGAIAAEGAPAVEEAASLTTLSTLLLFANYTGYSVPQSYIDQIEGIVFTNAGNVSDAIKHATYGHYELSHAASVTVDLNYDATTVHQNTVESDMRVAAEALPGINLADYDRVITLTPAGTNNSASFAYAERPGKFSTMSDFWSRRVFDGYIHELGHNFGLHHAGKGADEYDDPTCVMGRNWRDKGAKCATYSAAKKVQKGWFNAFPGSYTSLTEDATFDLYPISVSPGITSGMRAVRINGTDYFISYRKFLPDYGWLRYTADADKVYVHSQVGSGKSWRLNDMTEGTEATAGTTTIRFERYGDAGKSYATVSFDLDDGNAKPVADAQSVTVEMNTAKSITLTGSDSDTGPPDTLTFDIVTDPANGVLSGSLPNLTYTPNNNFIGADSFVFKVNDGKISSFATVSITVTEVNVAPVADNQSVNVFFETAEPITLTASDGNGDPLTYAIVSGPGGGTLSGTAPNLTYTPDGSFSGSDSFTFKANDGIEDSNIATVSITVSASPNTAPEVEAGPNQTVYLETTTNVPGLYYGTVSGDINLTDPNPQTQILVDPSIETENDIADNTTEIYTGYIYDEDGAISFTEHIDDEARIWIDGVLYLSNDVWNSRTSTGNLNLDPGWHTIEIRISNGGGGSGPVNNEIGIGYDPDGGTTWRVLTDLGDGSFLRVNANTEAATATLSSTSVSDSEQTPTYVWTDTGTGTGAGTVTFSDANALSPTVTFTATGTYVLRLTADDGYVQTYDEVTITVEPFSNTPPSVTINTADQTIALVQGAGGGDPVAGAQLEWDAAADTAGDDVWNTTVNSYNWTFTNGVQSPSTVTDGRFDMLTKAYDFPEAKSGNQTSLEGSINANGDATWEFVLDADADTGLILESGGVTDGFQFWLEGGALKGHIRDGGSGGAVAEVSHALDATDMGRFIHAVFVIDMTNDTFKLYVDNVEESSATWTGLDWCGSNVAGLGAVSSEAAGGSVADFDGKIALIRYYQDDALTPAEVTANFNSLSTGTQVQLVMDATVTDAEQTPTSTWSVVSGPASAGFSDINDPDATATFTEAGTYVLRLTGDDGYEQSTDEVTITVSPALPASYQSWADDFGVSFTDTDPTSNPDGDPMSNMMEFAFGTDPTASDGGALKPNGSAHGAPTSKREAGGDMYFYFIRRIDHGSSGSVSYKVYFSDDLTSFIPNDDELNPVTKAGDSDVDATKYEVARVQYPAGARFARIEVDFVL